MLRFRDTDIITSWLKQKTKLSTGTIVVYYPNEAIVTEADLKRLFGVKYVPVLEDNYLYIINDASEISMKKIEDAIAYLSDQKVTCEFWVEGRKIL